MEESGYTWYYQTLCPNQYIQTKNCHFNNLQKSSEVQFSWSKYGWKRESNGLNEMHFKKKKLKNQRTLKKPYEQIGVSKMNHYSLLWFYLFSLVILSPFFVLPQKNLHSFLKMSWQWKLHETKLIFKISLPFIAPIVDIKILVPLMLISNK